MDKFQIADNPISSNEASSIIHLLDPRAIIFVDEEHITTQWPHRHYTYRNIDGQHERFTLSMYHCMVYTFDGEEQNIIIEKLFKEAWHWFMAYMTWEDRQIDKNR